MGSRGGPKANLSAFIQALEVTTLRRRIQVSKKGPIPQNLPKQTYEA